MRIEEARILYHAAYAGGYRVLKLGAPAIAAEVVPGQFVHVRIPGFDSGVLRRPFSVFRVEGRSLSILYKSVGKGTRALAGIAAGQTVSLMGPLGNGFPLPGADVMPVLVAGGYGVAPLCFLAERMRARGAVFIGGAGADDILCLDDFRHLGWEVQAATEDGSRGTRGLVTVALDAWLTRYEGRHAPVFYACGPEGLLKAVGERAIRGGWQAWLSMDRRMGCAVGACLMCVHRLRQPDGSVAWGRVCREGPVFECRQLVWDDGAPPARAAAGGTER